MRCVGGLALLVSLGVVSLGVVSLGVVSLGVAPAEANCLSAWEIQDAIAQGRAIEPRAAISAARRALPGADVMRGGLCRDGGALVYQVLMLRKDGRLVHVTIDAPSGKVIGDQ